MDKENFNFRPSYDPLKSVSINDVFHSLNEKLKKEIELAEETNKTIVDFYVYLEEFRKYKERNKAE